MKKLDQQLTEVNLKLDTQAEQDSRTIDQLSQDRERLHAELTRVRKKKEKKKQAQSKHADSWRGARLTRAKSF